MTDRVLENVRKAAQAAAQAQLTSRLQDSADAILKRASRMFREQGVPRSFELERVAALPRRDWTKVDEHGLDAEALAELVTKAYKTPEGTIQLWPRQARVLQELADYGGALALLAVGTGKTIVSFLAPTVVEAERALLIVPAKLREKTHRDFCELARHFEGKPPVVLSYEKLSRQGSTELLQHLNPDLLILDECHRAANKNAACVRRLRDWKKNHPDTKVLAMSGTITKRSLHNFAHLLEWCLGKRRMPLPATHRDLEDWARAVDVIEKMSVLGRISPGALADLYDDKERAQAQGNELAATRSAVRRRIVETHGVVASEENNDVDASLNVVVRPVTGYGSVIEGLFEQMNRAIDPILPNGDPVTDNTLAARWQKSRELTSGFWYEWDPRPPDSWLLLRRAWKDVVVQVLDRHLQGLESEGVIASILTRAGADGLRKFGVGAELAIRAQIVFLAWQAEKPTFKPNSVPRWESTRMLDEIAAWAKSHRGLVWISEVALGERLDAEGILPYYGQQGLDRRGRFVEDAKSKDGSIALSVGSNAEGRNLQHQWWDNLVVSCPPTGTVCEQMFGRVHRFGQPEDEVWFEILVGCGVEFECWQKANRDATYGEIEGRKKLSYCSKTVEKMPWGENALWPDKRE